MHNADFQTKRDRRVGFVMVVVGLVCAQAPANVETPASVVREQEMMKDLRTAIAAFAVEYGRFPMCAPSSADDIQSDTANAALVASLLGKNSHDNPRGITFIELPQARAGQPGVTAQPTLSVIDSFGHAYRVMMDANRDGRIANPDRANSDGKIRSEADEWLPAKVIVQGAGEDGIFNTADDCTSWRECAHRSGARASFRVSEGFVTAALLLTVAVFSWKLLRWYSKLRHGQA